MPNTGTCACGNTFTRPDRNWRCRDCAQRDRALRYPDHASISGGIKQRSAVDDNGCWIWLKAYTAGKPGSPARYGTWPGLKIMPSEYLAHRISYIVHVGPIPEGLTINHRCRVHKCVNPEHLELMTRAENIVDGNRFIVDSRGGGCKHGHLPERMKVDRRGYRSCLDCKAAGMYASKHGITFAEASRRYPTVL